MSTYILESVVTHTVLILAYWVFLRQENQYGKMRFYLLGATLFSIVIPLFRLPKLFATPPLPMQELSGGIVTMTGPTVAATAIETPMMTFDTIMWFSFLISGVLLLRLISKIIYLVRLERRSICESYNGYDIRRVADVNGSFTFFNWVFLSDDINHDQKEYDAILKHEQAHAQLKHSYDLIFFELFKVFFWWLPSSWYINKEIKRIHEYQADAYALRSFNLDLYSSILIKTTLQSNGLNIVSSFHDGLIFKRLKAMKQQARKVNPWKSGMLMSLCVCLFLIFACSEERSSITAQSEQNDKAQEESQDISVREIFKVVEEQPSYEGGMSAFTQYVISEMRYPLAARKAGVEGIVQVQFVIERDGSVSNVKAVDGIGSGCDEEAIRVIKNASGFKPGSQRGRTVRVQMEMPLTFKLNTEKKNPDGSVQGMVIAEGAAIDKFDLDVKAEYKNGIWSGTIRSAEGDLMPGVNIVVADSDYGTVSDLDGTFSVKAEKNQELHISFVGYSNVKLEAH